MATNSAPAWWSEVQGKYRAGIAHAFILHGNVRDYVLPSIPLRPFLTRAFGEHDIAAFYDREAGITFPEPQMRERAVALLGLDAQTDALGSLLGQGARSQGQTPVELPRSPAEALPLLGRILQSDGESRYAVVIDYAETVAPAQDIGFMPDGDRVALTTLRKWGADINIRHPIFLIVENLEELHPSLRAASAKWEAVYIPLPDYETRVGYISTLLAERGVGSELTAAQLAGLTAGLSRIHIEDIVLRAGAAEAAITIEMVRERKADIIRSEFAEVLELVDPVLSFDDIGGLTHIKDFFLRRVIEPVQRGAYNKVPMGILLTGPAGTGKTIMAEAVAKASGFAMAKLAMSRILGGIVGTSERNLAKALGCIDSLAPCLVFIDEIDQSVTRGTGGADPGGGGQVNRNIFQRLLEYMSDTKHRGRVVFLAATNRPDLLDAALKRPGRFDKKVPFFAPDEDERVDIVRVLSTRYLGEPLPGDVIAAAAARTDGWTGAELEALVLKVGELMDDGHKQLDAAKLALERFRPSTRDIEWMTDLALAEINDLDLVPPRYQALLAGNRAALEARTAARAETGRRGGREL